MAAACGTSGALYGLLAYLTGCGCMYSCFYRSKMRRQYMLPETPCGDCLVHFCCETCALCQEYRELKIRGFDMPIGNNQDMWVYFIVEFLLVNDFNFICFSWNFLGWQGNVEKQNGGVTTAPNFQGVMNRWRHHKTVVSCLSIISSGKVGKTV